MTKEERKRVIERLEAISECNYKSLHSECLMDCENCGLGYMIGTNKEYAETISLVLAVLKQEPCEDAISRKSLLDATFNKNSAWNAITNASGENLEEIISSLPSVTPKLSECEDAISRKAVADIMNRQRFGIDKISWDIIKEKLEALPSVTPQPIVCEDTVSRKDLVEWLENIQPMDGKELGVLFDVREHVKKMQPTVSARELGEWVFEYDNHIAKFYHCSVCGRRLTVLTEHSLSEYPYCHCGADMRGTNLLHTDKSGLNYADQPALRSAT